MPVSGCQEQRRAAILIDRGRGRAGGEQELGDRAISPGACGVERGHAVHGADLDPRAGGDEFGHDLQIIGIEGGVDQRGIAACAVRQVERCATRNQRGDGGAPGRARGQMQRGLALARGARGSRRTGGDERRDQPIVALQGRQMQRGHAVLGARRRRVGATFEQQHQHLQAVLQGRGA